MLASSSKRARSSMITVTSLPACAAALERLMQGLVAGPQGRKDIVAGSQALRNARRECRVLELGAVDEVVQRHQPVQIDGSGHFVQIVGVQAELTEQVGQYLFRAIM